MNRHITRFMGCILPVLLGVACTEAIPQGKPSTSPVQVVEDSLEHSSGNTLEKVKETDKVIYFASKQDIKAVDEIDKVFEEHYSEICKDLGYDYRDTVIFEIYPDQKSFDENPSLMGQPGYPAVSGDGKIQMVSPSSPVGIAGIPYKERLLMAVHEFTHLVINQINQDAPIWMQEGIACYEGSKGGYEKIIKSRIRQLPGIGISELEKSYEGLSCADVYSYLAVRYIIESFGYEALRGILKEPENFEQILNMNPAEFDMGWNSYLERFFSSQKPVYITL